MITSDRALDVADRIARRLCRDAVWSGARCTWLGWQCEHSGHTSPRYAPVGPGLYGGSTGIALFLGYMAAVTGDRVFRWCFDGAVAHAAAGLEDSYAASCFRGLCGFALTLVEIGHALDDGGVVERGLRAFARVAAADPDPRALDVIGGSAGCIPALLRTGLRAADSSLIDAAVRHGDELVRASHPHGRGAAWPRDPGDGPSLAGFAHGAGGHAYALCTLYRVTQDERYARVIQAALDYQATLFDPVHRTWRDMRTGSIGNGSWCHGSAGVGLSRLLVRRALRDASPVAADVETAVAAVTGSLDQFADNYSLCHGLFGAIEFFMQCLCDFDRPELSTIVADTLSRASAIEFEHRSWRVGLGRDRETPGLLPGLAGIGYTFLRFSRRARPVSILAIDPWASR